MTEPNETAETPPSTEETAAPGTEIVQFRSRNSLSSKVHYARELANSGLLPAAYRRQPANVLYAIEYGEMLKLSPMAAITGIHIIDGKPSASAALMSALVRRDGHRLRVSFDAKSMTATAVLVRADDREFRFEVEWTLSRAVQAGLCSIKDGNAYARDSKGKPLSWEKYTQNMLKWRAISEVCRDGAEECLMGVHYTPEELGAEVDDDGLPTGETIVEQVDWDAEIRKCGNSRERLLALHANAPNDAVKAKIVEAAKRAGVAKAEPENAPEKPAEDEPETVDAEIVEDEPTPTHPVTAKGRLDKAIRDNGWDKDIVADLFAARHNTELDDATSERILDEFRTHLFSLSDGDLKATAKAGAS